MKNSKNQLLRKTFIHFLIEILIWTIIIPLFFYVFYIWSRRMDTQWIYNFSPNLYFFGVHFVRYTFIFALGIWFIGIIIIIYLLLRKVFSYINALSIASEQVFNKDIEYIELPMELNDFQTRINYLKYESIKNERRALENEQRKNDLVVYLAHDLKTPLTSMIGYLSLLDEVCDMPSDQRKKYIRVALEKSYKLEDLINELFDITRFNSETIILEKEKVHLNLMLEQIIDDFYPVLIDYTRTVELVSDSSVFVYGDSDKLARVFNNVIKNAIYYSTEQLITIEVMLLHSCVRVVITNSGKKISDDKLARLFEKFYRVDSARTSKTGGSGLGLAIAKEIVELHDGKIWATSDMEYTRFYIELPVYHS